jgi:hypothetical protein
VFCYFRLFSVFFRFHFFKKKLSTVFHTLQPLIGILFFIKSRLLSVLFEYRMLFFGVLRISLLSSSRASHTLPCKLLSATLGSLPLRVARLLRIAASGRTWPHMAAHGRTWPHMAAHGRSGPHFCSRCILLHIAAHRRVPLQIATVHVACEVRACCSCVRAAVACVLQMRVFGRSGWLQGLVSGAGCSGTLCRLISQDAVSVLNAC